MRPGYPDAVYDDVLAIAAVGPSSRLFEIGCGTGHATRVFAARGLSIDCVELGENMAARARTNLAAFPRVSITIADFDRWSTNQLYDLAFSATAYHWLHPATRIERIAALLRPAAWIAVWRNHQARATGASEEFLKPLRAIYSREAPSLAAKFAAIPRPDEIPQPEPRQWIDSGLFHDVHSRVYLWRRDYTAADYVRMLSTHSDHRMLPPAQRDRLLGQVEQLIVRSFGGSVVREHATLLHMARKIA
jgi:trans-aconitate methyltransferase